jgi:hypothetical protein
MENNKNYYTNLFGHQLFKSVEISVGNKIIIDRRRYCKKCDTLHDDTYDNFEADCLFYQIVKNTIYYQGPGFLMQDKPRMLH